MGYDVFEVTYGWVVVTDLVFHSPAILHMGAVVVKGITLISYLWLFYGKMG